MPREARLKQLNVVAGILRDTDGRVLVTQRLEKGPFEGLWEFPGGKIGDGEAPQEALARELLEEIGIELVDIDEFMSLEHDYPDRSVRIRFFLVERWRNEPAGLEGQPIRWLHVDELAGANLLPADIPVIEALAGGTG